MTDDSLAARLTGLSPAKRALLERRLAARREEGASRIPRRTPGTPVPLSFAQWRLWFLEQLRPGTHAWNSPVVARVTGPLQHELLRRALGTVVARHSTLRTVFTAPGGRPEPIILEDPEIELEVVAARESEISTLVDEAVRRPFDLAREVTVRMRLLELTPEDHVLVLVAHHIACDGWSKSLLVSELSRAYGALCEGREPDLPELAIDYGDFALWQRDRLSGARLEELVAYWRERLAGHPPSLHLRTDLPRPARQAFTGATVPIDVPGALVARAAALGREQGATLFMTMLAAFKAFLHGLSGQEDILVGSPAAMRGQPELEPLIGFFANTLVYRTEVRPELSFRDLLARVRETALGTLAHQDLPFEKVVEALNPPRDTSRTPLVQVNLRVEGREPELQLAGARTEPLVVDPGISRFDLAIELGETDAGLSGYLEYDTALFHRDTAMSFVGEFLAVLEAVIDQPDTPLGELAALRSRRSPSKVD